MSAGIHWRITPFRSSVWFDWQCTIYIEAVVQRLPRLKGHIVVTARAICTVCGCQCACNEYKIGVYTVHRLVLATVSVPWLIAWHSQSRKDLTYVTISSDLSLDKHVSNVCAAGFFQLRQLRRVQRSLDSVSAATLVHAFVSSRVDYCNAVFAEAPKTTTDRLQRVLNTAARVVSDTQKFDRGLSWITHSELHWLDVPERINYKLGMHMYRCQHNKVPRYLTDHCTSVSDVAYRQQLGSASSLCSTAPASTYGRQAFAVAGPTVWNSLPEDMRDPDVSEDSYRQSLKTFLFSQY